MGGRRTLLPNRLQLRALAVLDLSELRPAVRAENGVSRRLFLAYGAALSSLPLVGARAEPVLDG